MIHPQAVVELQQLDNSTNVWAFAHVMAGARIGRNVNIGDHAFVESGAWIGDNVTLKNAVAVWKGVTIENDVFVGPGVTFTNDKAPRSPRGSASGQRYVEVKNWLIPTRIRHGCSLGAAAIVLCGLELGPYCMVAAGAIVTKDVPAFALVIGNPARHVGDVCSCGVRLEGLFNQHDCRVCGETAADRIRILSKLSQSPPSAAPPPN